MVRSGVSQTQKEDLAVKIPTPRALEEAKAALKVGDLAAFGEGLKEKRSADLAAAGCCIIA